MFYTRRILFTCQLQIAGQIISRFNYSLCTPARIERKKARGLSLVLDRVYRFPLATLNVSIRRSRSWQLHWSLGFRIEFNVRSLVVIR